VITSGAVRPGDKVCNGGKRGDAMCKTLLATVLAFLAVAPAMSGEVVVYCPGTVQVVVRELAKSYEQKSGNTVTFEFATAGAIEKHVAEGAEGDVVLATNAGLAALARQGKVDGASIRDLGSMGLGVAVRRGTPKPDIHDVDAFKASMLAARSIMYANPSQGGQSGLHVARMFAKLGIDKQIEPKLQLRDRSQMVCRKSRREASKSRLARSAKSSPTTMWCSLARCRRTFKAS
jgi:molybdate transport system substrate-binding protein